MNKINYNMISECLYLQKDEKNTVFLNDHQLLKQHQIDGLRFLFRQFKKKRPAAVVNFPPECGKSVTVALLLNILKNIISKPILILCNNKNEMNIWNEIIQNWTDYTADDIAIESLNVYLKKKIFIKHMEDLTSYLRRSWSIVIFKDDVNKNTFKLLFDADFKIWITSTNVKNDLKMLSLTYNWLTKLKMDAKDFIPSGKSIKEKIHKTILLDSFLEDFLLQETRIEPFKCMQLHKLPDIEDTNEVRSPKKSRKNKDASGTKIKKSKRIIDDNTTVDEFQNGEPIGEHCDNLEIRADQSELNVDNNKSSESLLQNYEKVDQDINMDVDGLTEDFTLKNAAQAIVETENLQSDISTPSIDFDDITIKMHNDFGNEFNDKDHDSFASNVDTFIRKHSENNDKCLRNEESTEHKKCFVQYTECDKKPTESMSVEAHSELGESAVNNDLVLNESIDIEEKGTDIEIKGECHNDIDAKISELEEKTLKKFKGSLLDSIF